MRADIKIEDGITWVLVEAHGVKAWVNLEFLRQDPIETLGPIKFMEPQPRPVAFYGWASVPWPAPGIVTGPIA